MVLATGERLRIACSGVKNLVPGDVVRLHVRKSWKQGKTRCVSGDLDEPRLDVRALQLAPLALFSTGPWTRPEVDTAACTVKASRRTRWSPRRASAGSEPIA